MSGVGRRKRLLARLGFVFVLVGGFYGTQKTLQELETLRFLGYFALIAFVIGISILHIIHRKEGE